MPSWASSNILARNAGPVRGFLPRGLGESLSFRSKLRVNQCVAILCCCLAVVVCGLRLKLGLSRVDGQARAGTRSGDQSSQLSIRASRNDELNFDGEVLDFKSVLRNSPRTIRWGKTPKAEVTVSEVRYERHPSRRSFFIKRRVPGGAVRKSIAARRNRNEPFEEAVHEFWCFLLGCVCLVCARWPRETVKANSHDVQGLLGLTIG